MAFTNADTIHAEIGYFLNRENLYPSAVADTETEMQAMAFMVNGRVAYANAAGRCYGPDGTTLASTAEVLGELLRQNPHRRQPIAEGNGVGGHQEIAPGAASNQSAFASGSLEAQLAGANEATRARNSTPNAASAKTALNGQVRLSPAEIAALGLEARLAYAHAFDENPHNHSAL